MEIDAYFRAALQGRVWTRPHARAYAVEVVSHAGIDDAAERSALRQELFTIIDEERAGGSPAAERSTP